MTFYKHAVSLWAPSSIVDWNELQFKAVLFLRTYNT